MILISFLYSAERLSLFRNKDRYSSAREYLIPLFDHLCWIFAFVRLKTNIWTMHSVNRLVYLLTHIMIIFLLSIFSKGVEFSVAEDERFIFDIDVVSLEGIIWCLETIRSKGTWFQREQIVDKIFSLEKKLIITCFALDSSPTRYQNYSLMFYNVQKGHFSFFEVALF